MTLSQKWVYTKIWEGHGMINQCKYHGLTNKFLCFLLVPQSGLCSSRSLDIVGAVQWVIYMLVVCPLFAIHCLLPWLHLIGCYYNVRSANQKTGCVVTSLGYGNRRNKRMRSEGRSACRMGSCGIENTTIYHFREEKNQLEVRKQTANKLLKM